MGAVGHSSKDILKDDTTQSHPGSGSTQASIRFKLSHEDSLDLRIDAVAANTSGSVTLKLQTAYTSQGPWFDAKSVTVTDGNVELKITKEDSSDATYLPLRSNGRIVLEGAGTCDIEGLRKSDRR